MLRLRLFDTGYCTAAQSQVMRGAEPATLHCHALAGLIEHPTHGLTLFDVGYAPRMLDATSRMPWRIYRYTTPLFIRPEEALVTQLGQLGIQPADIQRIIVSHMHADHIAGLRDFPTTQLILSAEAMAVADRKGLHALRSGLLPQLLPDQLKKLAQPLPAFTGPHLPALGPSHDLFGDGSLLLLRLPGHAYGQIGALLQTDKGPVLLAADGAWTSRAIREVRPPASITHLFVDNPKEVRQTLEALHTFAQARPDVRIVPTHCPEVFAALNTF